MTPLLREFDVLARLLVFVLPSRLSEELVGDLIEEARTFIAPASGARAARRWLLVQLASSLPHMLSLHLERELKMDKGKIWGALVIVLMGALQAWDSGVLGAPPAIGLLVVLALAMGVIALFFAESAGTRLAVAIASVLLLFGARALSPVPLPELGLVGFIIMMVLVFFPNLLEARKNRPPGPTGAA